MLFQYVFECFFSMYMNVLEILKEVGPSEELLVQEKKV